MTARKNDELSSLNFAIAGCGRIATRHAQHIDSSGTLVATCDIVVERAKKLAEPSNANAYGCIEDMLRSESHIDVVAVCTPNGLHAEHTIAAFKAGCHVLCEKPMAISVADCGAMIQAAERANRRLFIVKQNRFNPPVVAVKELLDEGRLGRLYSIQLNCFWNRGPDYYRDSWKGTHDLDGGCLYTQFSHFIDLLYWFVGDVKEAFAMVDNYAHRDTVDFEDTGVVALRFHNGVLGTINFTTNAFGQNMEGSLTIFAERGTVKIGGQYLNELEYQRIDDFEITGLPAGKPANSYGQYQGSMSNHDRVYENLVEVLTKNGVIATNGYEGLKTVEIIDKVYTAARRAAAH
ncbi:MAG TPA: Gfo/Idh/MocA family oxidoreductase [Gemmatimonadaceae bacterium]|nr:Gfo/Idh/MocA family oxidoreductase [Gemmatimonadaceae bacterium]